MGTTTLLHAVIEKAEHNYSAYLEEVDGVGGVGDTLSEVRRSLEDGVCILKEGRL